MTLFLVIEQVFRIFPFFPQIFRIVCYVFNVVYDPFLTRTIAIISEKYSFMTPFLLCSYFRAHPTTLLLKNIGGTDAWAVPPPKKNFEGLPPSPPKSPPLIM